MANSPIRELARGGTTLAQLRRAMAATAQVIGVEGQALFPALCHSCGQAAAQAVPITRSFLLYVEGSGDSSNETQPLVETLAIPLCQACQTQRGSMQQGPPPWLPVQRIFSQPTGPAGLVVIAISCLFFKDALLEFRLFPLLLGLLPLGVGLSLILPAWKKTRYMALAKPTAIDQNFDFTPILSLPYEPAWRAYYFALPEVANRFQQANQHQLWDAHGQAAKEAAKERKVQEARSFRKVGLILIPIVLWYLWDEFFSDLLR